MDDRATPRPASTVPLRWGRIDGTEHLDLEFSSADRPALVTSVLAACAEPAPTGDARERLWALTLAGRIGGLLEIHAATTDADDLPLVVRCPYDDCGEGMELTLPAGELLAMARDAESEHSIEVTVGAEAFVLRRPCGADQRGWQQRTYADRDEAEAAVIETLVLEGQPSPGVREALADALRAFDPLPAFELDVVCPSCDRRADIPIDLEAVLLNALARGQDRLIRDVDLLARRYGWSEEEVLALPRWRRRRYLALAGADGDTAGGAAR